MAHVCDDDKCPVMRVYLLSSYVEYFLMTLSSNKEALTGMGLASEKFLPSVTRL